MHKWIKQLQSKVNEIIILKNCHSHLRIHTFWFLIMDKIMIAHVCWQLKICVTIIYLGWAAHLSCETQTVSALKVSNYNTTYHERGCKIGHDSPDNSTRIRSVHIIVLHSWTEIKAWKNKQAKTILLIAICCRMFWLQNDIISSCFFNISLSASNMSSAIDSTYVKIPLQCIVFQIIVLLCYPTTVHKRLILQCCFPERERNKINKLKRLKFFSNFYKLN